MKSRFRHWFIFTRIKFAKLLRKQAVLATNAYSTKPKSHRHELVLVRIIFLTTAGETC